MKPLKLVFAFIPGLLTAASVTLSPVYMSIGPDANTSASYAAYIANAQTAITTGQTSVGGSIQTLPTAYNALSGPVNTLNIVNTPFPSWLGVPDPTNALTGQLGNMLYWGVIFTGPGISLSQITVTQSSTDALDSFGDSTQPGGLFTKTYSSYAPGFIGITSSNTIINSGPSTQQVNEIVITGFAAALSGYGVPTSAGTDAQKLQQIDNYFASFGNFAINTCFYYGTASSSNPNSCDAQSLVSSAPEPSSFGYASLACAMLVSITVLKRK